MQPSKFEQSNVTMAAGQPQYRALPVFIIETHAPNVCQTCGGGRLMLRIDNSPLTCPACSGTGIAPVWKEYTCRYELNEIELAQMNRTKGFFFTQSGFGFNPILPQVENHFRFGTIEYRANEGGTFNAWIPLDSGEKAEIYAIDVESLIDSCLAYFPEGSTADILSFTERPTAAIDEHGNMVDL